MRSGEIDRWNRGRGETGAGGGRDGNKKDGDNKGNLEELKMPRRARYCYRCYGYAGYMAVIFEFHPLEQLANNS